MDRDKRWERVALAYDAMVDAKGPRFETPEAAVQDGAQDGVQGDAKKSMREAY